MIGNVAKWGNSLAISIPQQLAKEVELVDGAEVEIVAIDGHLTSAPTRRKRYSLTELVAGITPENLHTEIDTGLPVGDEVW
jgi:antitoxin MazE